MMSSCRRLAKFFTPRRRRRRGKCTHADNVGVQLDCVCVHAGLPCRSPSSGLPLETAPQLLAPVMAGRSLPLDTCLVVSFIFLPCCFCCFFSCFAAAFAVFFFCSLCCCFLLLICCCAIAPFVAGTVAADAAAVASVTASYCSNNRDSAALADAAVAAREGLPLLPHLLLLFLLTLLPLTLPFLLSLLLLRHLLSLLQLLLLSLLLPLLALQPTLLLQ